MNRFAAAALFAILGLAAITLESLPFAAPLRLALREWLGANALPETPERIVAIRCDTTDAGFAPLDAALVLRAVERFKPAGVAFLAPIADEADVPLLLSKLHDSTMPVVFTGSRGLPELPNVTAMPGTAPIADTMAVEPAGQLVGAASNAGVGSVFVAGSLEGRVVPSTALLFLLSVSHESLLRVSGSIPGAIRAGALVAPIRADGFAAVNPLAGNWVSSISLDDLLLRIERSERGEISAALDVMLRDRLVVVEPSNSLLGTGVAALRNGLVETASAPAWISGLGVILFATLPWWARRRVDRIVLTLVAALTWVLLALGVYQEFRIVSPVMFVAILPLLAGIPIARTSRSNESQQGKPAAEH